MTCLKVLLDHHHPPFIFWSQFLHGDIGGRIGEAKKHADDAPNFHAISDRWVRRSRVSWVSRASMKEQNALKTKSKRNRMA